jgi:cobalt-zinc-cadmium efflux system outer membrane protein
MTSRAVDAVVVAIAVGLLANVGAQLAGCAPTRAEIASPVADEARARIGYPVAWRGADAQKDRAVDEAVQKLLSAPLDIDSVVAIALVRHPSVQVALATLGMAQADLVDAGLLSNPRVGFAARSVVDGGTSGEVELDVEVEQPLLTFIFREQRVSIAEARRDEARARAIDVVVAVAAGARRAFVDAVAAHEVAGLARAELDAEETRIVFLRSNYAAGNQTALDLVIGEARYQAAVVAAADAEREARVAHEGLLGALGLWGAAAPDRLAPLPSSLAAPPPPRLDGLERAALTANARLLARRAALDAEARALGYVDVARFLPDLDAGVAFETGHGGEVGIGPAIGVALPVFDQGQGAVLRRQSALALAAAQLAHDAIALRVRARQTAVVADNAARRAAQIQTQLLPPLDRVVDEMERRLNGMLVTPDPLVGARRAQLVGRRELVGARRGAWLAAIDVQQLRAGGTPDVARSPSTHGASSTPALPASGDPH